jgi:hypothetical protein
MIYNALLSIAAAALIALLGFIWRGRVRATRRWKAALDGYAEREIIRDGRSRTFPA